MQPRETRSAHDPQSAREALSSSLQSGASDDAARPAVAASTGISESSHSAAVQGLGELFASEDDRRGVPADRRAHRVLAEAPAGRPSLLVRAATTFSKACLMCALVWGLFFNFSEVRGSSMRPGIHDGDRILVDHVSYMFATVAHGDIIVMRYPLDPTVDYVKRVVGLPGDHVEILRGQVWLNGARLEEDYVAAENIDPWAVADVVVEPGHFFVLGDNRIRSSDSRDFGQVPEVYLRGKVRARLWPFERVGLVH
jgi:signal peptidase I